MLLSGPIMSATQQVFSPSDLFLLGEQGAWYDPSDLSTLWQDTSATTPITADGQSVARVDDKSGNGNHLLQATAANRPLYKTDGSTHWLLFDGSNDYMSASSMSMNSGDQVTIGGAYLKPASSVSCYYELSLNWNTNTGSFYSFFNSATMDAGAGGSTTGGSLYANASITLNTRQYFIAYHEISPSLSEVSINGGTYSQNTLSKGTGNFSTYPFYLGSRGGSSFFSSFSFFGLVVCGNNLSTTNRSNLNNYFSGKI